MKKRAVVRLNAKINGKKQLTSYQMNISKAEAELAGFIGQPGKSPRLIKTVDQEAHSITLSTREIDIDALVRNANEWLTLIGEYNELREQELQRWIDSKSDAWKRVHQMDAYGNYLLRADEESYQNSSAVNYKKANIRLFLEDLPTDQVVDLAVLFDLGVKVDSPYEFLAEYLPEERYAEYWWYCYANRQTYQSKKSAISYLTEQPYPAIYKQVERAAEICKLDICRPAPGAISDYARRKEDTVEAGQMGMEDLDMGEPD